MTYGIVMEVPAPIEFYDAMHAELARRAPDVVDGLLLHLARQTGAGFQIVEVWESKELCERYTAELVGPVMAELSGGRPPPGDPAVEEFEPRGLVVPAAHVFV
ncbi:hypothetical protein [Blastococcus sp. CCUG 61487]|uniref:hypothetical protein n=1 Tax=Blastococcus sp. CCUG 61487 TaxID=1840703 RepID=UPI0010C14E6F|nr:hypothetical protein [Blastococcus sp. CCUG 61487]TKJ31743.1 hypothetical protein A6V29_18115 [Blastococcus sp. CCUG 61487]